MRKQYRVQLDFTIEYDEANIRFDSTHWKEHPGQEWVEAKLEKQRALFRALLSQPAVLKRYLAYRISGEIESSGWQTWDEALGCDDLESEDILLPVIATLGEQEKTWFTKLIEEEVFPDHTEEFDRAFTVSWDLTQIIERVDGEEGA